jgi:hypothetical protein
VICASSASRSWDQPLSWRSFRIRTAIACSLLGFTLVHYTVSILTPRLSPQIRCTPRAMINPTCVPHWQVSRADTMLAYTRCFPILFTFPLLAAVEFNRDIRPVLADKCFTCHGPDSKNRFTKLRFDTEPGAKQDLGGRLAIAPGDPANSEMIRRINSANPANRMPPPASGYKLTGAEIDLIRRWIEEGAAWQQHWAWIRARRPELPKVHQTAWPRNSIDYFVLDRLEQERLSPSPEAGREYLIRRVTLDLTGLPPAPAEVDAFLADTSPDAYEKVVDRLLASPRYGERMAQQWLDAARYADSHGYQSDGERPMWRWRDWVIGAYNRNMPFDEFTVDQIAGDMLPRPTIEQRVASGFNRNHRQNGEGGIVPEEYQVEYVVDRVDTTATVWLGLTLACARCHDHKYDPFTQKEFYQVFAYFNNIPEKGLIRKSDNAEPFAPAPDLEQQEVMRGLERAAAAAEKAFAGLEPERVASQRKWEESLDRSKPLDWSITHGLAARYSLSGNAAADVAKDKAGQPVPGIWREGDPEFLDGRIGRAASFDGKRYLDAGDAAPLGKDEKFTFAGWVNPTAPNGAIISRATDIAESDDYGTYSGYGLFLKDRKLQVSLIARWPDRLLRVETEQPVELNHWSHVVASYDGSSHADGVRIYIDGQSAKLATLMDDLNAGFAAKQPLRIGAGGGPSNRFGGRMDDVRVYQRVLSQEEAAVVATPESIADIAALPSDKRTRAQADKIRLYFLEAQAPPAIAQAWREQISSREKYELFLRSLPTVMVMEEMPVPRTAHVLIRGVYDRPGEKVNPAIPAILPPLPPGVPNNRLGFARWLVEPSNPLTSRVAVNRFWEMYFGTGLVKTLNDFGSQGEWPSHPALLDWLATEFIHTGWNVKAMQKLIVTSASYRQSSKVTPELLLRDPENRLLARGPRLRLPAEMIRDQVLEVSGLLVDKIGGPAVKPYQPAGLWKEILSADYPQDHGESLYRRSLYTFWRRTAPPPSMMNFDAAGRETCVVRRSRTNTPLQALDLMNDVTYLEAARMLAERMMREGGQGPGERIAFAFRLATARRPAPAESEVLVKGFHYHLDKYLPDRQAALKYLSYGEHPRDEKLDPAELAAYTAIASLILNLDETITKI